jgi:arylformamidase
MICDLHAGTHIDAPRHFLADGATIETLPLEVCLGPAYVAYLPEVKVITAGDLDRLALEAGVSRLLLKTANSNLWAAGVRDFQARFVDLSPDAARWLVQRRVRLVGIDYLSVERPKDDYEVHRILMTAGVVILETLDLSRVAPGWYELICLPLPLAGAEASPTRAVLRRLL